MNRLVAAPTTATGGLAVEPHTAVVDFAGAGAVRLRLNQPGRLDTLRVHAVKRTPLSADQVEVRVTAAGVNAGDVLKAKGAYPGPEGAPALGAECVGVVTDRGSGVGTVEIGQRVIAFGPARSVRT